MKSQNLNPSRFAEAARFGFRVFPVKKAGKAPAVPSWKAYDENPASPEQIVTWDASHFNTGVICGTNSGVIVLDVDSPEAQALVDRWGLPATPCVSTGRGRHYYFRHPGFKVGNSVRIAGTKLDIRGDGGYVVGAGSLHESGAIYEWTVSPDDVEFADLPPIVLDQLKAKRAPAIKRKASGHVPGVSSRYPDGVAAALASAQRDATIKIAEALDGERNDTLFSAGARLASMVAAAGAEWEDFTDGLRDAAKSSGLGEVEIDRTLASCWKSGSEKPDPFIATARKWVYLSKPNGFYHVESREMLDVQAFNNTHMKMLEQGQFGAYLLRNDLIEQMHDFVYEPQSPEGVIKRDGLELLNTYRSSGLEATEGDASPFEEFLSYLVPDEDERSHLLKMIAWTVRHPGEKLRHALLFRSEHQGVGKTMLTEIWAELLGTHNVRKSTTEEITGQYQGFIMNTQLVVLEELNLGAGMRDYNRLKELISNDIVSVNEKYEKIRNWRNVASFVMLTNLEVPLQIEASDRRIFFIDSPALPRDGEYYADFAAWWQANPGVIKWYLNQVDLTGFRPAEPPPMTRAKQELIADSRTELARDVELEINLREGVFQRDIVTLAEIEAQLGRSMHGKTKVKLTAALKTVGAVPFAQQRVPGRWEGCIFVPQPGRASLWAIRNVDFWAATTAGDRAEEYARAEGMLACFAGLPFGISHSSSWPGSVPWHVTAAEVGRSSEGGRLAMMK